MIFFLVLAVILLSMPVDAKPEISTKHNLVEIKELDPSLKLDIKYATKENFLGRPVYKEAKAFLQREVAEELIKINKELKAKGYSLIIFDGYRPWSVTKIFWDETPIEKRTFVADPKKGSIHNRGCAVDLSLLDLKTGSEVKMPCPYDEFSERAYPSYKNAKEEEIKSRNFLIYEMEKSGKFKVNAYEWWHFDYKDCDKYPILDLSFEDI